ncbi:MAG: hypothetical protein J5449_00530 [Oscillospiraceae bacterium]|nr:hypothetical protein [Oscillospiraceae bacterium]
MGQYFDDLHAMPDSQLGGAPCLVGDSPETAEARGASDFDALGRLAKTLDFQLRYREAIPVYGQMLSLRPDDAPTLYRLATREINTLQPRLALGHLTRCRELDGDKPEYLYRIGISHYLAGDYSAAMDAEAACFPLVDDEMGVAAMYWHTLAAWRSDAGAELLNAFRPEMKCGHHTAYYAVMSLGAGHTALPDFLAAAAETDSDLEYSMLAYGASVLLARGGDRRSADELRKRVIARDGFWISYAYLAAWNDEKRKSIN